MGEADLFNPWRELRARPWIELRWTFLRGQRGLWVPETVGSTIHLDPRLGRRERRCVLAHELVHEERGIAYTRSTPTAMVQIEERCVERETVRRLVPPDDLMTLVHVLAPDPVTVIDVADWFDVDWRTARAACSLVG